MKNDYVMALVDKNYADPFILPAELLNIPIASDAPNDYHKALGIYNYIKREIRYSSDYPVQRNALDVFVEKKGNCIEQSFLFVTLARFYGLDSKVVMVYRDDKGNDVSHACAAVFFDDEPVLVDPTYKRFNVSHKKYCILEDEEVRRDRMSFVERRALRKNDVTLYSVGDIVQYLRDFRNMPFGMSDRDCFFDNARYLGCHLNDLGKRCSSAILDSVASKEQIDYAVCEFEERFLDDIVNDSAYLIGKSVRNVLDLRYTGARDRVFGSLHFMKESLPSYLGSAYDASLINRQIMSVQDEPISDYGRIENFCISLDRHLRAIFKCVN